MKVEITTKYGNFAQRRTAAEFATDKEAETSFGKIALALPDEKVWSDEYRASVFFLNGKHSRLCIFHSAFLDGRPLIIRSIDCSSELTVNGVKEAILARIGAQLKDLQKQSTALQLKSASLSAAQDGIFRATAKAAVVAKFPEAAECQLFAPYGWSWSDLTCFILGHGFGHTIFVACGTNPEFNGGIVQIDMQGDEWHRLATDEKYGVFFVALARAFVTQKLQVKTEDHLCCPKMSVTKNPIGPPQVDKVVFEFDGLRIDVTFGGDNLPIEAKFVD